LYKVIQDLLPKDEMERIKNIVFSNEFPFYLQHSIVDDGDEIYNYMFSHLLFLGNVSDWFLSVCPPILERIPNYDVLLRAKVNCYTNQSKNYFHGKHLDGQKYDGYKIGLFSLNTNNGKTILYFDNETIEIPSVENQLVIFDGNVLHESVGQTDTKFRMNINFNYTEKE
jgi:hypothetical protein